MGVLSRQKAVTPRCRPRRRSLGSDVEEGFLDLVLTFDARLWSRRRFVQFTGSAIAGGIASSRPALSLATSSATYINPIIAGDHPDAGALRVGDDYYLPPHYGPQSRHPGRDLLPAECTRRIPRSASSTVRLRLRGGNLPELELCCQRAHSGVAPSFRLIAAHALDKVPSLSWRKRLRANDLSTAQACVRGYIGDVL